jgi:hypothetical protein
MTGVRAPDAPVWASFPAARGRGAPRCPAGGTRGGKAVPDLRAAALTIWRGVREGDGDDRCSSSRFFATAGDARQVWARRRDQQPPGVFFLPEGGVTDEIRRQCAAGELVCPMADCPDPRFIARGGDIRRHHFAHHVAHVKHATAAVWRTEAMTMLADWAAHYRRADVDAEDRDGVARVRVRSQRSGRRVELRVTYDRRYEPSLEDLAESSTQLLVGHTRGLLLPREPCQARSDAWWCGEGRLVGEIVYRAGWAVAVNPEQRLVATLVGSYLARDAGLIDRRAYSAYPLLSLSEPARHRSLHRRPSGSSQGKRKPLPLRVT